MVVDDTGSVTGIQGNILEKFGNLSKAKDATADADNPTKVYYKDYLTLNSKYIYLDTTPRQALDTIHGTEALSNGFSTG